MRVSLAAVIVAFVSLIGPLNGLQPTNSHLHTAAGRQVANKSQDGSRKRVALNQSNQFDVSKPVFDLLAFRTIRGDAIIRYDAMNQSEPIRILLYAIYSLVLLASPSLADALDFDALGLPATIATTVGSVWFGGLFVRECKRRSNQLNRIEKELNTEMLPIRLPANALSDRRYTKPMVLKQLAASQSIPPRIIALCGTKDELMKALKGLQIYGKRLQQASVYVVCVPLEQSTSFDAYEWMLEQQQSLEAVSWLADSYNDKVWRAYFNELAADYDASSKPSFLWFGLNSNGRSIGSGVDEIPMWLQLFGQHFRPTMDDFELMEATSTADSTEEGATLAAAAKGFYAALTTGDQDAMNSAFSESVSDQVSEVIDAGGRLDAWKECLAEGARPEGMQVSAAEVIVVSDTEAYTTVVESAANTGLDSATLLAVQKWTRSSSKDERWKLSLHQTIPWDPSTKAQGTLRCDCRGCVALTRASERQTFGGLIG